MDPSLLAVLKDSPCIRTGECARLFGVSRKTVRRLANQGLLPHWRSPGNQRRFDRAFCERVAAEADGQETLPMEVQR